MARVSFDEVEGWMERREMRPADAAREFGVSTQTFNGWKKRGQVSADESDRVRAVMLSAGPVSTVLETATDGDYLRIRQIEAEAGMGEAAVNDDYPEVIRSMDFTEAYIRGLIGFVPPPGRLCLVTGRGDSMIPIIQPGEVVLVDTGIQSFDGDGTYLLNTGNGQQIKGLQDRGDSIYVVSANTQLYPAFPLPKGSVIGGKVYLRNRLDRLN
jgi:phage repressor protein C with HTH and peptisase S24 domain